MISPEIISFARNRIDLQIVEQDKQLDFDIERIKREMASRQMLHSGNMIAAVQDECVRAVNERAKVVWETLHRGITSVEIEYAEDLQQQLRAFVDPYFPEHMNGLRYRVIEAAKLAGLPDVVNRTPDEVGNTRRTALAEIHSEIDLFVMTLKKSVVAPMKPLIPMTDYVHQSRINELAAIDSKKFDLKKLIQFCHELNSAHSGDNLFSIIMLCRAIIDHVPPIFGMNSFNEVANNYAGTSTFKKSMERLNSSSRQIADLHLHTQIRNSEVLPNITQVNFSNDLDVLLSEIVRLLNVPSAL